MADSLRPQCWSDYIGQTAIKAELEISIAAAKAGNRPLHPLLLTGAAGAGKSALATIIAHQMHEPLHELIMPINFTTLEHVVSEFEGVFVLDEIHELSKTRADGQHALLPLLEHSYVQNAAGQRTHAGQLTIIGCTTEPQMLIGPLLDRFFVPTFDPYTDDEMCEIVIGMATKADVGEMDYDVATAFGVAACGVPRRARQFVIKYQEIRDSRRVVGDHRAPTAADVMSLMRTTDDGLTINHVRYIELLHALGGTAGLTVLSRLMKMSENVVVGLEELLFRKSLLTYGPAGRQLTRAGRKVARANDDAQEWDAA